jgi:hypothetical protein
MAALAAGLGDMGAEAAAADKVGARPPDVVDEAAAGRLLEIAKEIEKVRRRKLLC